MKLPGFETEHLVLEPATRRDLDAFWAVWRHPDVRRYLFDDMPVTRERADEVLTTSLARKAEGLGLWAVRVRGDDAIVGTVGLVPVTTAATYDARLAGAIEAIAAFEPGLWGRGYATEALATLIDYAFGPLALSCLAAVVDVPNQASHRMITRLGFTATGDSPGPRYSFRSYALTPRRFTQ